MSLKSKYLLLESIVWRFVPDSLVLHVLYRRTLGKKLHLRHPVTFNEKLQWLKIHDRNPLYSRLVDKYEVKSYVADRIGSEYLIPTLGVWNSFEEIDFDSLPSEGYVLKCTHDSGSIVINDGAAPLDKAAAREKLSAALKRNFYRHSYEWPYKNVRGRIIAEPYLTDLSGDVPDYKFFCCNGQVKFLFVATSRFDKTTETRFDFFDPDFRHLPFTNGHPMADVTPSAPERFDEMLRIAETLSAGIPFVRIDLYNVGGKILFGEYTFFHWSGFVPFDPEEWDEKLGREIELPKR